MLNINTDSEVTRDLKVRACWHYYIEGLNQGEVAEILGITRLKVNRMLKASREEGIVQFHIGQRSDDAVALEKDLVQRFGLAQAIVVPSSRMDDHIPRMIGQATARYIDRCVEPGDTIAVTWGRTLKQAIIDLPARPVADTSVVSMIGGVAHAQPLSPAESAWGLADKLGAECYCLPVPIFADSASDAKTFMRQKSIQDVLSKGNSATFALVSVGALSRTGQLASFGFVQPREFKELIQAGAVGDILCHFVDADGATVNHPLNERLCAFPLEALMRIPSIVLSAGGADKAAIIRATLKRLPVKVLITDVAAATALLSTPVV